MRIVEATAVTPEIIQSIGQLIPQLSSSAAVPTTERAGKPLSPVDSAILLIARDPNRNDRIVWHPDPGTLPHPHRRARLDRGRGRGQAGPKTRRRRAPLPRRHRTRPRRRRPKRGSHLPFRTQSRQPPLPAPGVLPERDQPLPPGVAILNRRTGAASGAATFQSPPGKGVL